MGPSFAAKAFRQLYDDKADRYEVTLYGSLAATGKGHMTDVAIENELKPKKVTFIWKANETLTFHVNGMTLKAFQNDKEIQILHDEVDHALVPQDRLQTERLRLSERGRRDSFLSF